MPSPLHAILAATSLLPPVAAPPAGGDKAVAPALQSALEDLGREGDRAGGPVRVLNQLHADEKIRRVKYRVTGLHEGLGAYFDAKARLAEEHGFRFGMDYTALGLWTSRSPREEEAASGAYRLFGAWDLIGRRTANVGRAVFKLEHRHRYTGVAAAELGPAAGYVGIWGEPFDDTSLLLTNLYWEQRFAEGEGDLLIGLLDLNDSFDTYALGNPWTSFLNLAFTSGSAAAPLPREATLGAVVSSFVGDNVYLKAGISDVNADPSDPFGSFETFFDESEYFYFAEIGYVSSQERRAFDDLHLTVWGVDETAETGAPDGWGINASYTEFVNDTYMPFVRGGWSEDAGSLLSTSISAGIGWYVYKRADVCGFAVNWGEPNETTLGPGLEDQFTFETFYRIQVSPNVALTPDLQFIVDPALNPGAGSIWVLGLRARLAI